MPYLEKVCGTNLSKLSYFMKQYFAYAARKGYKLSDKVAEYELSRINSHIPKTAVLENCQGRWQSLHGFVGKKMTTMQVNRLFEIASMNIRKITRYVLQIGSHTIKGEEYRRIKEIFANAHCWMKLISKQQ